MAEPNNPQNPQQPPRPAGAAGQPVQPGAPRPAQPAAPRPAGAAPAQPGAPRPAQPGQPAQPGVKPVAPGPKPAAPQGVKPPGTAAPGAPAAPRPTQPGQAAQPGVKPVAPGPKPAAPQGVKPVAPGPKPAAPQGVKPAAKPAQTVLAPTKAETVAERGKRKLGQVLIDLGFIDEDQLWELLEEAKQQGKQIGQAVVDRGLINSEQLLQALSEQHGLKLANLSETKPTPEAMAIVPETMANIYKILPLAFKDRVLTIVVSDPANATAADDLRNLLSLNEVQVQLASPEAMQEAQAKAYNTTKEESVIDVIKELETSGQWQGGGREASIDLESALEMADSAPVRKLINMIFLMGIRDRASDIHFEPFEEEYRVRMKADGVLYELVPPPRQYATAISSRIKVMSNLDITERRLPQDGRIELNVGGNQVDMRVSVLPTLFGESIVIRILDRTAVKLELDKIGMAPEILEPFKEVIEKPNGIILVTGPTGSGKTTTLYSALSYLNRVEDKIITTEDPVEYEIEGLVQCPINHEIGLTFASALRAILRQDPDRILVGEIRDLETAQIAVQASLTGHTVFSTLHTNDAPSTITRMRDMGLEPFLITATVEAVLAQRLVRTICQNCREEFRPSAEMLIELNLTPEQVEGKPFFFGKGCDKCNNTGYKGRMGLHELIIVDDDIRDAISGSLSTDDLRAVCEKKGMISLRESGMRAIHRGKTTIDEVVRETVLESN
ncbi:MAG: Flp pilus assembly complex ATPase component TadA [Gemmataceae bacterium]|nr:Flp pilus assembly complex ATPase component TadA [Gemmataceae bacterium]